MVVFVGDKKIKPFHTYVYSDDSCLLSRENLKRIDHYHINYEWLKYDCSVNFVIQELAPGCQHARWHSGFRNILWSETALLETLYPRISFDLVCVYDCELTHNNIVLICVLSYLLCWFKKSNMLHYLLLPSKVPLTTLKSSTPTRQV